MGWAWKAQRPASVAKAMALAMVAGWPLRAMALLINRASAPASMARAASLGTPMPASTTTGTWAASMIRRMFERLPSPWPLPMGEARGITVAQPTCSSRWASTGSALI